MARPLKNTAVINIKMPPELKAALTLAADSKGIATNDLIRMALREWLKKEENKK